MTRVVRILTRASDDIDEVFAWLAKRSPAGAQAWHAALMQRLADLRTGKFLGSPAPESEVLGIELRHAFFKTRRGRVYRVLFLVIDHEILVLRVRGPGQKPVGRRDIPTNE